MLSRAQCRSDRNWSSRGAFFALESRRWRSAMNGSMAEAGPGGGFVAAPTGNHGDSREEVAMYIGIGTLLLIILIVLLVLYVF